MIQIVIFRFDRDNDLALAWMYARHRGPTPVSSCKASKQHTCSVLKFHVFQSSDIKRDEI